MEAIAFNIDSLLSNKVAPKNQFQNSHFRWSWSLRAHLLEFINQTACPWKVCWIWQTKRDQRGGRPKLGSQLLEAPWLYWSQWICVGFSMQGPSHPKAWKGVPGLFLPKPLSSSPSTAQTVQCSQNLLSASKSSGCHPALDWQMSRSWGAAGQFCRESRWSLSQRDPIRGSSCDVLLCLPALLLVWGITPEMCVGLDSTEYVSVTAFSNSWEETTLKMVALI